jgi:hypothetical protein
MEDNMWMQIYWFLQKFRLGEYQYQCWLDSHGFNNNDNVDVLDHCVYFELTTTDFGFNMMQCICNFRDSNLIMFNIWFY